MPIPDRDIASPSPSVGGSTVSNEENGPAEADSPELKRLHAVGDTFRQILSDPIVADQYMKWFRDQCAAYQLPPAPAGVESCEAACKSLSLPRTIIEVPETYYSYDVTYRRYILRAPSDDHLCKTVVFENRAWRRIPGQEDELDPRNSRFYLVIVQYTAAANTGKLLDFVRSLTENSLPKKSYNFRLAGDAVELTGYGHNEVAPVGTTKKIPIIISAAITKLVPPMFYAGAGHRDWKLALPVDEFLDRTGCMVADLS